MRLSRRTVESARRAANSCEKMEDLFAHNPITYKLYREHMIWNAVAYELWMTRKRLEDTYG